MWPPMEGLLIKLHKDYKLRKLRVTIKIRISLVSLHLKRKKNLINNYIILSVYLSVYINGKYRACRRENSEADPNFPKRKYQ